jgi:mono/diheme cytochrome c family protein
MRTRHTAYFLLVIAAVCLGVALVGRYLLLRGLSARDEPSAVEAFFANRVRRLAIPGAAKDAKNPVLASPEVMVEAMAHFADHCAFCHANDGSGSTAIGKGLYPKPPDMRLAQTQNLSDGEIFYIIQNGVRLTGMPAFGQPGKDDEDSWKLVHFIRRLPGLTAEELEHMKELNPKTPDELKEEDDARKFLEGGDAPPAEENHKHHH